MFSLLCLVLIAPLVASSPCTVATVPDTEVHMGGFATYYDPSGGQGACEYNAGYNYSMTGAIDSARFGNTVPSPLCGHQVKVTNVDNNKSVTVTITNECGGCRNANSIDLTPGAFERIGDLQTGVLSIKWIYAS